MPELPDVEALRWYLIGEGLVGRTFLGATVLWPRAVAPQLPEEFAQGVAGRQIREIARRAKLLLFRLGGSRPATLVMHLRMTGSLLVEPAAQDRPRHTRNVLHLDDGRELRFVDPRKLGTLRLVEDEAVVLSGLGPEPLDPAFTPQALGEQLRNRSVPVKALLCDQAAVAGIGNIYADEVLFAAGIHPLRRAADLTPSEVARLHRAVIQVLPAAIEGLLRLVVPVVGPPTESEEGLKLLRVPRREGQACSGCGGPVRRLVIRGRSAYFCPRCQPS